MKQPTHIGGNLTATGLRPYAQFVREVFLKCGSLCAPTSRILSRSLGLNVSDYVVQKVVTELGVETKTNPGNPRPCLPTPTEVEALAHGIGMSLQVIRRAVAKPKSEEPIKKAKPPVKKKAAIHKETEAFRILGFEGYILTTHGAFHAAITAMPGAKFPEMPKPLATPAEVRASSEDPKIAAVRRNLAKFTASGGLTNK